MKEINCKVEISFSPETLKEAAKIICKETKDNAFFRDAVEASIASAIRENPLPFADEDEIAEKIVDRLIGED